MKNYKELDEDQLLTTVQAAEYLPYKAVSLNIFRQRGTGPKYLKIGGNVFYKREHIQEFLEGCVRTCTKE